MRYLRLFFLTACCGLLLSISAWAQEPSPVPEVPEVPEAPEAPETPETHIRRHKMGEKGKIRIEVGRDVDAALEAQRRELEQRIAELEERMADTGSKLEQAKLEALQKELQNLEKLRALEIDLPDIVFTDPDQPRRVLVTPDGSEVIILDPPGGRWRKKRGDKVAAMSDVYVDAGEWIEGAAIAIFGNVYVTGHVEKDVVSIGGDIYVDGTVEGNVVAPFGDVYLNGDAYVEGDVVSVDIYPSDEAVVGGTIDQIPMFHLPWMSEGPRGLFVMAATIAITKLILGILLGWLILAVAPAHVDRIQERLKAKPVGSFFAGVLVQVLALPVFVLLLVTVIGIPLALLALPLVLLAAVLLGFVAFSRIIGDSIRKDRTGPGWGVFPLGAVILFAPVLIGLVLALPVGDGNGVFLFASNLLLFLGVGVMYLLFTTGMGAAVFSRLGTRSLVSGPKHPLPTRGPMDSLMPPPPVAPSLPPAPPSPDAT
jgi:hypothetical protein